jgi:hypothetical protein
MLVIEPKDGRDLTRWSDINWTAVEANVRRLQGRIYRATVAGEHAKVKNLQKLLVRSMSAKLLAIRRITQENQGKHTAGIDGVVCATPEARHARSAPVASEGRPEPQGLPTQAGAPGLHPKSQRQAAALGDPDGAFISHFLQELLGFDLGLR